RSVMHRSRHRDGARLQADVAVAGTVHDAAGSPIAGASVEACCSASGNGRAVTDKGGAFELKTAAGERTFTVSRDGLFLLSEQRFVDGSAPVALVVPPAPRPDATLRGTVKDQHGAPVAGLTVEVYSHCCPSGEPMPAAKEGADSLSYIRPHPGSHNRTVTDAAGRYTLGVLGGGLSVNAHREGYSGYSNYLEVKAGETKTLDIQLMKHPAKSARVEGRVVDGATGQGLRYASIIVQSPAYGIYECSMEAGDTTRDTARGTAEPVEGGDGVASSPKPMPPQERRCALTIAADGTFSGQVTPGYAIVQVHYNSYRACPPSEDGNYRPCAPEYYSWSRSLQLAADQTTTLEVELRQRPAPDAVVSGYLLDDATGKPIAGGQVTFGHQDGHGWGHATTDKDGSYRIKIRSGPLEVSAYAEGHLHWVGVLEAARGETPLDIRLVPGGESHGPCCYAYGREVAVSAAMAPSNGKAAQSAESSADFDAQGSAPAFEDLKGGLGPYDAAARARTLDESRASPAAGLLLLVALMGCGAWLRRR
ncbi:MAG TPA: carboxypeptidase-like regulatory domain-containing protein, partial [Candidatus Thermoplasmatota archaeon]|nr:carboxypeptidase-like regulatory domain-containing protein [Candidatus Thermoplasmatota archaeon]